LLCYIKIVNILPQSSHSSCCCAAGGRLTFRHQQRSRARAPPHRSHEPPPPPGCIASAHEITDSMSLADCSKLKTWRRCSSSLSWRSASNVCSTVVPIRRLAASSAAAGRLWLFSNKSIVFKRMDPWLPWTIQWSMKAERRPTF
jgi:hypothetical protein